MNDIEAQMQQMLLFNGIRFFTLTAIGLGILYIGEPDLHGAIVQLVLSWADN